MKKPKRLRVVLTGGPGAGKTIILERLRERFESHLAVVPETATMLWNARVPRLEDKIKTRVNQLAIYAIQNQMEALFLAHHPDRVQLCDRGTVDGVAYWPGRASEFYKAMKSTEKAELARYDFVLFFESTACLADSTLYRATKRIEPIEEARAIDARLRSLWERHPGFRHIPVAPRFEDKVVNAIEVFADILKGANRV